MMTSFPVEIKSIQDYALVNFKCASFSIFRDFFDGEVDDGSGGMNVICSQQKVADDAISGKDVRTFR